MVIHIRKCTNMKKVECIIYHSKENPDPVTDTCISLYPDGKLTFLWNGIEQNYGKYDFENKKKIGE